MCLLPPNTTDRLQPMDISVNKPAKDFLRKKFQEWYADQVTRQLQGKNVEEVELEAIDLPLPLLRELGAGWLVEMFQFIADNPQFIVNGFAHAGITGALDFIEDLDGLEEDDEDSEVASDDDESEVSGDNEELLEMAGVSDDVEEEDDEIDMNTCD